MDKKDVFVEMHKVGNLVKSRIKKTGTCPPIVFSYSLETGEGYVQLDEWHDKEEKEKTLLNVVDWLKNNHTYGFVFATPVTRSRYNTPEDYKNNVNPIKSPGVLIVAQTPDRAVHLSIDFEFKDGEYSFRDEITDITNQEERSFLDDVYKRLN